MKDSDITNSIGMKLALVSSGEFMMGSQESPQEIASFFGMKYGYGTIRHSLRDDDSQHKVRINHSFYARDVPVTR